VLSQISIEDSYTRLVTVEVKIELLMLSKSLIRRMHTDLTVDDDFDLPTDGQSQRRWLAHPRTLRLSTRPRPPQSADGSRARTFKRISPSFPIPNFVFNLNESDDVLADKLVEDALIPAFWRLHPERPRWNLSIVNIAVTNIAETAADTKDSAGRDIGRMLKRQDDVLKDFKVTGEEGHQVDSLLSDASADSPSAREQDGWNSDVSADESAYTCKTCSKTGTDWSGVFGNDPKAYVNRKGHTIVEPGADKPPHNPINPSDDEDHDEGYDDSEDRRFRGQASRLVRRATEISYHIPIFNPAILNAILNSTFYNYYS
jgi:hypothetical protein